MDEKERITRTNRRQFLKGAAALVAAGVLEGCKTVAVVPRQALGGKGFVPPSEKINLAAIGVCNRGAGDIISMKMTGEVNLVAFCDVDFSQSGGQIGNAAAKHPEVPRFQDWRVLFDTMGDKIDAVTVSTPDHNHFPISMAAIERGIHVFCQKPLTHSIKEARLMAEAARKAGVATQMGIQGHAGAGVRKIHEWYRAGALGKVREVHIWARSYVGSLGSHRPPQEDAVPEGLNWDVWLGPAPVRPYVNGVYHPGSWRAWFDFGGGALGDFGCHSFDIATWVLDLGYPEWVEATSSAMGDETYPRSATVTYQFPARGDKPPVRVVWYGGTEVVDGQTVQNKPGRPSFLEEGRELPDDGQLYYGEDGASAILCGMYGESPRIIPEARMKDFLSSAATTPMARSAGHYKEFTAACKGGEPAGANFDYSGPLTEVVFLGNIAMRSGQRIEFDPKTVAVTNSQEANRFLSRAYRDGWVTESGT